MTLQTLQTLRTLRTRLRALGIAARIEGRRSQGRRAPVRVCVVDGAIAVARRVRRITIVRIQRGTISIRVAVTIVRVVRVSIIAVVGVVAIIRVLVLILVAIILILIRVLIVRRWLSLVSIAAFALLLAFLILLLVGDAGRAFALFGLSAADVNGHRLTGFDDFAGVRQLQQHCIGLRVCAVARSAHAHIQTRTAQLVFSGLSILAKNVRHLDFGTAQAQIDRAGHAEDKSQADGDDYSKPAEGRPDAPNETHLPLTLPFGISRIRAREPSRASG